MQFYKHKVSILEYSLKGVKLLKLFNLLTDMVEKPFVPKFYKDLQSYYESKGMKNEADAFEYLLKEKFKNDNSSDDNSERRADNQRNS